MLQIWGWSQNTVRGCLKICQIVHLLCQIDFSATQFAYVHKTVHNRFTTFWFWCGKVLLRLLPIFCKSFLDNDFNSVIISSLSSEGKGLLWFFALIFKKNWNTVWLIMKHIVYTYYVTEAKSKLFNLLLQKMVGEECGFTFRTKHEGREF